MKAILAAIALLSCNAYADFNPLEENTEEFVQENFVGIWRVYGEGAGMTVTIDQDAKYLTLLLDDVEAMESKIIDVDEDRKIVTVSFRNVNNQLDEITLRRDKDGDLWFTFGADRFPMQYTRRITERDRARIECIAGPVKDRDFDLCAKMGL